MKLLNKEYFVNLQKNDFTYIQLLRGLAASLVVFYHFTGFKEYQDNSLFYIISSNGDIGVWIFFAISGYVISYSAASRGNNPNSFIINRFLRIYPPYLLAFILAVIVYNISIFITGKSFYDLVQMDIVDYIGNLLFVSNLFEEPKYINGVFWTLCYEMQFYLFIYLVLKYAKNNFDKYVYALSLIIFISVTFFQDFIVNSYFNNFILFLLGFIGYKIVSKRIEVKLFFISLFILWGGVYVSI